MLRRAPLILLLSVPCAFAAPFDAAREAFEAKKFARAAELARPLAEAGDVEAQDLLGHLHATGSGVKQDHAEAIKWFKPASGHPGRRPALPGLSPLYLAAFDEKKDLAAAFKLYLKAAEEGNHYAQHIAASCYVLGRGTPVIHSAALSWYRKAADQGNPFSPGGIGWLYKEGMGVARDYAEAVKWFKLGLERGDRENAAANLAHMYQMGWGVKQDYGEARRLYLQAAELGNQWAQNGIGSLHLLGWGGPVDHAQALKWLKKAADQGNAYAPNGIGHIYREGLVVKQDFAEAARWFKLGIERGDKEHSVAGLGLLHELGQGVPQDYAQAARLYRQSAELGNEYAQVWLGHLLLRGLGVAKDDAEALKWFRRSAEQGLPASYGFLAYMLRDGIGTKPDFAESLKWAKAGLERGDLGSITNLAVLYETGKGVARDYAEAARLYRLAIERGNEQWAQLMLGGLYEDGRGTPQDFVQAYRWYVASAAQGNESAREKMNKLRPSMTPEQLAEAQRLAAAQPAPVPAGGPKLESPKPISSDVDKPGFKLPESAERFALVVGIENYKDLPAALYAERDAAAMREHLRALGYPERNIVFLAGPNATATGLTKYLEEWLPRNVKPGSTVFFYFSGHGAPDPRTGEAFLVPWDGDAKFLASTAVSLKSLYAALARLKSRTVVVLDACFSGAGGRSVLAKGARPLVSQVRREVPEHVTVLAASASDEITSTAEEEGHGLFTYHLLKGLGGAAKDPAGRLTPRGIYDYLLPRVQDGARRQNREQTPALQGPGDVEFARFR